MSVLVSLYHAVSCCVYIPYRAFASKCALFRPIRKDWQIDFATATPGGRGNDTP